MNRPRLITIAMMVMVLGLAIISCKAIGKTRIYESNLEDKHFEELKEPESGELVEGGEGFHEVDLASDCQTCHPVDTLTRVSFSGIRFDHKLHLEIAKCAACHGDNVHSRDIRPGHERCNKCHARESKSLEFSYFGSTGFIPSTHDSEWDENHGGEVLKLRESIGSDFCGTCHQESYCTGCHGVEMPHPGNWKSDHAGSGPSLTSSCAKCHGGEDVCTTCHGVKIPHADDWMASHGQQALAGSSSCAKCHDDEYCTLCHGVKMPHADTFFAGHGTNARADMESCTLCHTEEKKSCSMCHGVEMPHPDTFITDHGSIAGDDKTSCLVCHSEADFCSMCHGS